MTTRLFVCVLGVVAASALLGFAPAKQEKGCCGGMMEASQKADDKAVTAKTQKGVQTAKVMVASGRYNPATINVKAGKPVELAFRLGQNPGCGNVLVIKELKIKKDLSADKDTIVKFTPKKKGTIDFTCGMGMYKGKIVVS